MHRFRRKTTDLPGLQVEQNRRLVRVKGSMVIVQMVVPIRMDRFFRKYLFP